MKKSTIPRNPQPAVSPDTGLGKNGIMTRMALLVSALGLTSIAHAGLIVEEGFGYTAGALNGTQAGGLGLTGNWGTSSTNSIATPGLGFTSTSGILCTNGAGRLDMGYGATASRVLSTPVSGASLYFSMVINLNGTVESYRTGFEFRHSAGTSDGNLFGRVNGGWGILTGPAGDTGVTAPGGASYYTWKGVTAAADSNAHFIVYKLDYQANAIKMWVDPSPGSLETAPTATLATGGGWTVNLNNQVADSIRAFNESSHTSSVDEFRVGSTWADVTFAGPVSLVAGGTYQGNWKSLDPATAAVTIATTSPVTITNSCILSKGTGIFASWSVTGGCPANLTVTNTYGLALNPNVSGTTKGSFIGAACVANLVLTNNYIEGWAFGVAYNQNNGNNDGVTNTVKIKNNRFVNIDSRYSDGNGGYLSNLSGHDHSGGHDILLQNAYQPSTTPHAGMPGVEIAWNEFIKEPFLSAGEDVINLYESLGTSTSPILIHDNFIFGAFPGNPLSLAYGYYSGGGIIAGDGGTITVNAGYASVYNNQVVATLNYGLASDFGHDNTLYNNRVLSSGFLRNGLLTPQGNCGLLLYNYRNQTSSYYYNNNINTNLCGFVDTHPYQDNGTPFVQNAWSANAWLSTFTGNTWWTANSGFPTVNDENAEYNTWVAKLAANSQTVGLTNTLPSPLQTLDIGLVTSTGGASYNSGTGTYTVQGSGAGAGAGNGTVQATYTNSATQLAFSPSKDGLLATDLLLNSHTFINCTSDVPPFSGFTVAGLTDGAVSTTDNSKSTFWNAGWPVTLTFNLNTNPSTGGSATGYSISEIETIGGWTGSFVDQRYTLWVKTVGSSSYVQVGGSFADTSVTGSTCSTRTVLSSISGAIASNVQSVQLVYSAPVNGTANALVIQEVAICGSTTADAFRGVYESVTSSSATVITKVNSLSYTSAGAQAGLVIRDSTYPAAVSAGLFVTANGNIVFNGRTVAGGLPTTYTTLTGLPAPIWLKLVRSGSTFTASYSTTGSSYTTIGSPQTISMTSNTLVGLAVNSNAGGALNTAVFSNVTWP